MTEDEKPAAEPCPAWDRMTYFDVVPGPFVQSPDHRHACTGKADHDGRDHACRCGAWFL